MVIADFIIIIYALVQELGKSIIVSIYGESWWSFGSSLKYIVVHSNPIQEIERTGGMFEM